ncbi:hypothetical protein [Streptomyces omiyaensis]|uniref:Uncharacterized protein n=1 Tax=Streptomyces omiyaensis TaxID=68247 RepID=A0ABW7C159_9ACTN|nr:hypothetical protein [Streptomyces omiyaensis]GGY81036.1 hypothetical protein GCM10010363_72310 [Streptomyces omiyaensis]
MAPSVTFLPGHYTPAAGAYVCDCTGGHVWRIDLAGHLFPPFPPNCGARTWRAAQASDSADPAPGRYRA